MSIRPVDIQISIQKVDQFTKNFNNNNQALNLQEDQSQRTKKQATEIQRQVVSTESTMQNRIDRDGEGENKPEDESYKKDRKGNKKKDEGEPFVDKDKGTVVDISI